MGSHRVGHDWSDLAAAAVACAWQILLFIAYSQWHYIRTVDWEQKMDRYLEVNKNNIQGLEALIAWDTDSHISQVLSLLCLRTSLEVHAGIIPVCRWDIDRLWESWTHPGWRRGEKLEVSLGPGLSTQSCTHSPPGSCVEGCVVQLCEARGCIDE